MDEIFIKDLEVKKTISDLILEYLRKEGKGTSIQISRKLNLKHSSIQKTLTRLSAKGKIEMCEKDDRYNVYKLSIYIMDDLLKEARTDKMIIKVQKKYLNDYALRIQLYAGIVKRFIPEFRKHKIDVQFNSNESKIIKRLCNELNKDSLLNMNYKSDKEQLSKNEELFLNNFFYEEHKNLYYFMKKLNITREI